MQTLRRRHGKQGHRSQQKESLSQEGKGLNGRNNRLGDRSCQVRLLQGISILLSSGKELFLIAHTYHLWCRGVLSKAMTALHFSPGSQPPTMVLLSLPSFPEHLLCDRYCLLDSLGPTQVT